MDSEQIDNFVAEADEIFTFVRERTKNVQINDSEKRKNILNNEVRPAYKTFFGHFPVVVVDMVMVNEYQTKIFRELLEKYGRLIGRYSHAEKQAHYRKMMYVYYSRKNKYFNVKEANYIYDETFKKIKHEQDRMEKLYKETEEKENVRRAENIKEARSRLKEILLKKQSENVEQKIISHEIDENYVK